MDILSFKTSNLEIHRIKSDTFPSYPPNLTSPEAMAVHSCSVPCQPASRVRYQEARRAIPRDIRKAWRSSKNALHGLTRSVLSSAVNAGTVSVV